MSIKRPFCGKFSNCSVCRRFLIVSTILNYHGRATLGCACWTCRRHSTILLASAPSRTPSHSCSTTPHQRHSRGHLTNSRGKVYLFNQFREKVPMCIRNHVIAMLSEFPGTFLFMFIGLGGNSVVISNAAQRVQIAGGDLFADPLKVLIIATTWH